MRVRASRQCTTAATLPSFQPPLRSTCPHGRCTSERATPRQAAFSARGPSKRHLKLHNYHKITVKASTGGVVGHHEPANPLPFVVAAFPALLVAMISTALIRPQTFTWYSVDATFSLGVALFSITIATPMEQLRQVLSLKRTVVAMAASLAFPLLGLVITKMANLPPPLALGFVLLAACPPGTASNVVAGHISKAHLETILLTSFLATLLGSALYPATVQLLASASGHSFQLAMGSVPANFVQHAMQGILLPVGLAVATRLLLPAAAQAAAKLTPLLACCCILATASNKTALMAHVVKDAGLYIAALVFAWHAAALALGYALPRLLGADERLARTAAVQAGERNPALGLALASLCCPDPLVLAPCAISVFAQNILGSNLSVLLWARRPLA